MQIERLVVTLLADATRYNRIMDATTARLTAFATYAGAVLGKTAMQLASNYERAGIAFEVMTGSAEKGQQILKDVAKLALETPFSSDELVKSAKQVKAFGFETNDIIPILSRLGDVASGTGADMDRIILAFGQVRTTGRLMGQELRQFTNAGVPILENLAKVMGVSVAQVPNLVRQGKVGFSDVAAAFNLMTNEGGIFHKMMERINKETLSGRWENFKETLAQSSRWLGEAASEGFNLKENLTELSKMVGGTDKSAATKFFNDLRKGMQGIGFVVDKLWKGLKELWRIITDIVGAIKDFVVRNRELIGQIIAAVLIVKGFALAWSAVMGAIVAVNIAVATIIQGFALLLTFLNPVTVAVLGIVAVMHELGTFDGITTILGKGFSDISATFGKTWKGIKDAIAGGDLELAMQTLTNGLVIIWKTLIITMEAAWERFVGNMEMKFSFQGEGGARLAKGFINATSWMGKRIAGVFGTEEDQAKIEADRLKAIAGVDELKAEHNAPMEAAVQAAVDAKMAEIGRIPEKVLQDQLLAMAELTRFVGKDTAAMMQVIKNAETARFWNGVVPDPARGVFTAPSKILQQAPELTSNLPDTVFGNLAHEYFDRMNRQMFSEAVFAVGRVNHMLHERRVGLVPWKDEDIQAAAAKAKELQDKFKVFRDEFTKVAGEMVKDISTPLAIRPEVLTFARDLQKEFNKGVGPMEQYTHSLGMLNEAFMGPLAQKGLPGKNIGAVLQAAGIFAPGMAGLGADQLFQGIVNGKENDFGLFQAFEKLRNATKVDRLGGAGQAQMFGSREAQETINRSNAQMVSIEEQVLQTLRDANYLHQQNVKYQGQIVDAVKRVNADPAQPMKIGGPN